MKHLLVVILFLAAGPQSVAGFDYLGFRTGMSIEEARVAAKPYGGLVGMAGFYFIGKPGANKGALAMCRDKVARIDIILAGGGARFASMAHKLMLRHGLPKVFSDFSDLDWPRGGLSWTIEGDEQMSLTIYRAYGVAQSQIGFQARPDFCFDEMRGGFPPLGREGR